MKRSSLYLSYIVIFILAWLLFGILSFYYDLDNFKWLFYVTPWLLLVWFGCYCLARLGIDLLTFNDYPDEIKKLEKDIAACRVHLQSKGFKF